MHSFIQDQKSLDILRKRIENKCRKSLMTIDPDDLFQNVCVFLVERPTWGSTLDQIIIDVLRKDSGRKDSPLYDVRKSIDNAQSIDTLQWQDSGEEMAVDDALDTLDVDVELRQANPYEQADAAHDLKKIWPTLTAAEQDLLYDTFALGMTGAEIARECKISEASVGQYRTKLLVKLHESMV